jgi:hypothetical protein
MLTCRIVVNAIGIAAVDLSVAVVVPAVEALGAAFLDLVGGLYVHAGAGALGVGAAKMAARYLQGAYSEGEGEPGLDQALHPSLHVRPHGLRRAFLRCIGAAGSFSGTRALRRPRQALRASFRTSPPLRAIWRNEPTNQLDCDFLRGWGALRLALLCKCTLEQNCVAPCVSSVVLLAWGCIVQHSARTAGYREGSRTVKRSTVVVCKR